MGLGGVVVGGSGRVGLMLLGVGQSAGLDSGPGYVGKNSRALFTSLGLSFVIYKMRELNQNLFGGSLPTLMWRPRGCSPGG